MRNKGILMALFILALFSASSLSYMPLYALGAVAGLCYYGTKRALSNLAVSRRLSVEKAYIGQEVLVSVEVNNQTRFPLGWLSLQAENLANFQVPDPVAKAGVMGAKGLMALNYKLIGICRGFYHLGGLRISGGDPLGFVEESLSWADRGHGLTIYPRITRLADLPLPRPQPFGGIRTNQRAYEDPSCLGGIRDYQPGDSLRRVHWKASANRGKLQVKEFTPTISAECLILLNAGEAEYTSGHWAALGELGVETAASLLVHFASRNLAVGLASSGADPLSPDVDGFFFPPADGKGQAEAILTFLARVNVATSKDFAEIVSIYGRKVRWGTNLYLITPGWTDRMHMMVRNLKTQGKVPVALLLNPDEFTREAAAVCAGVFGVKRDRLEGGIHLDRYR